MDLALAGIFGAGVGTFFAPCVLPLIPVYLSALVGADVRTVKGMARGQLVLRSLAFSLGFILVFSLLGLGAAGLGSFFADNKLVVQLVGALVITLFGLKFLGVVRIPFLDRILRADDRGLTRKIGFVNAFFMGLVFAAGWSPCVGPILGSVLTYTAGRSADMITGALYLAVYGLGFALPLVAVAAFAEAGVGFIRRASRFLPVFERVMGVLLIAAAVLMLGGLYPEARALVASRASGVEATATPDPAETDQFPVMVEFYAEDCPVCQKMAPVMESVTNQCHGRKVEVRQVNITDPKNLRWARKYRIAGMPTFVLFDTDGFEVARLIGLQSEESIKQALSVLRGEPCPGVGFVSPSLLNDLADSPGASCGSGGASGQTGPATPATCGGETREP